MNKSDPRINEVFQLLLALASGDFTKRGEVKNKKSDVDALIAGLNMLGEELEDKAVSRDLLESIFKAVPDMLFILNEEHSVELVNPAVSNCLSISRETIIGYSFRKFLAFPKKNSALQILENIQSSKTINDVETTFVSTDGAFIPVSVSVLPAKFTLDKNGIIILARDISDIKQSRKILERINQNMTIFIAGITNEIYKPIQEILNAGQEPDPKQVRENAERLNQIHKMLLSYSSILNKALSPANINWANFLKKVKKAGLKELNQNNIQWKQSLPEADISIKTDEQLLKFVMKVLIDNILTNLSHRKVKPFIKVSVQKGNGQYTLIELRDNCSSLSGKYRKEPCQMFGLSESVLSGSMNELFLAETAVNKINGNISFSGNSTGGGTFTIFIPDLTI